MQEISLADYAAEKSLILAVPHRMLLGDDETAPAESAPERKVHARPERRRRDCPL